MKLTREAGLAANAVYFIAWIIALAGLSVCQDWCKDHDVLLRTMQRNGQLVGMAFLANEVGDDCSDLFRFPWFLLVLSLVPLLLSIGRFVRPNLIGSGSSALYAVLAALQILACDAFVNGADSALADTYDKVKNGNRLRAAGFAIMAAMSMLAIIVESLHANGETKTTTHTEPGAHTGGAVNEPALEAKV